MNQTTMFVRDSWLAADQVNGLWTKTSVKQAHEDTAHSLNEYGVAYIQTHALELGKLGLGSEAALAASYSALLFAFDKGEHLQFDAWRKTSAQIQELVLRGSTMSLDAAFTTSWMDAKSVHEVRKQINALVLCRPTPVPKEKTANDVLAKDNNNLVKLTLDDLSANKALSIMQLQSIIRNATFHLTCLEQATPSVIADTATVSA